MPTSAISDGNGRKRRGRRDLFGSSLRLREKEREKKDLSLNLWRAIVGAACERGGGRRGGGGKRRKTPRTDASAFPNFPHGKKVGDGGGRGREGGGRNCERISRVISGDGKKKKTAGNWGKRGRRRSKCE